MLQLLLLGVLLGGVYALMATGLTLLYGVMKVVNLAHAALMVVGAYLAFELFTRYQIDPMVSVLATGPVLFVLGAGTYRALFARLGASPRFTEQTVLITFGVALIVESVLTYVFGGIYHSADTSYSTASITFGSLVLPTSQVYAFAASWVALGVLWVFLHRTRTGYALRATMQNRVAAQILGVNVDRVSMVAFGIGFALAGVAGSLMSFLFTFYPGGHWQWIALLLSLIVVGGLGSLKGALVAGILLSVVAAFVTDQLGPVWSYLTFYLALFVVLMVRPQGFFGRKEVI